MKIGQALMLAASAAAAVGAAVYAKKKINNNDQGNGKTDKGFQWKTLPDDTVNLTRTKKAVPEKIIITTESVKDAETITPKNQKDTVVSQLAKDIEQVMDEGVSESGKEAKTAETPAEEIAITKAPDEKAEVVKPAPQKKVKQKKYYAPVSFTFTEEEEEAPVSFENVMEHFKEVELTDSEKAEAAPTTDYSEMEEEEKTIFESFLDEPVPAEEKAEVVEVDAIDEDAGIQDENEEQAFEDFAEEIAAVTPSPVPLVVNAVTAIPANEAEHITSDAVQIPSLSADDADEVPTPQSVEEIAEIPTIEASEEVTEAPAAPEVAEEPVIEEVAEASVVEEVAEEPVIEEVTEEPIVEEVAEAPVIEEVTEEPVVEEVAEEPVIEEVAEEPVIEEVAEAPVVEDVAEEPVVEEVAEEPVVDEVAEEPVIEEVAEAPVVEDVAEAPVVEDVAEEPVVEEVAEEPVVEEVAEASVVEEVSEASVVEEVAEEPVGEEVAEAPVVEEVAEEPVVEEVAEAPVIEEVAEAPVVEEVSEASVVEEAAEEPVVEEVAEEPIVEEAAEAPVVEEVAEEPVVEDVAEEPVVEEVAEEPVVEEVAEAPVVEAVAEEPAVEAEEVIESLTSEEAPVAEEIISSLSSVESTVIEEIIETPVVEKTVETPVISEITEAPVAEDNDEILGGFAEEIEQTVYEEPVKQEDEAFFFTPAPSVEEVAEESVVEEVAEEPVVEEVTEAPVVEEVAEEPVPASVMEEIGIALPDIEDETEHAPINMDAMKVAMINADFGDLLTDIAVAPDAPKRTMDFFDNPEEDELNTTVSDDEVSMEDLFGDLLAENDTKSESAMPSPSEVFSMFDTGNADEDDFDNYKDEKIEKEQEKIKTSDTRRAIAQDIADNIELFAQLLEPLNAIKENKVRVKSGIIFDWEMRIQSLLGDPPIKSYWRNNFNNYEIWTDEKHMEKADELLSMLQLVGIVRDNVKEVVIDRETLEFYSAQSEHMNNDFNIGETAVVVRPCWKINGRPARKGEIAKKAPFADFGSKNVSPLEQMLRANKCEDGDVNIPVSEDNFCSFDRDIPYIKHAIASGVCKCAVRRMEGGTALAFFYEVVSDGDSEHYDACTLRFEATIDKNCKIVGRFRGEKV